MTARSRPRARIAALKVAARFAPEAVRITSETAPIPIPTAAGWVRRQCSETSVAIPTTTDTTRSQGGSICQASARVKALIANATRYIVASTTRSRRPRSSSGASITTSGSAERSQPDRPSVKRAVAWRAIARGRRLGERHGRDPLPKSLPATTEGLGERSPRTVAANPAGRESAGMIETNGLTKQLGGRTVVSDVTFRCEPGTVTGFLGPNGAGKTTTMRMLVGLSQPDSGHAQILGGRYRDLPNPGRRVGILLDASAQHAGRRGREALAVSAHTMGVPAQRVDALLELVGLDEAAARRRVGRYSLGMRQRLGLAHALLGDPEVLILDEPANGLDPEGMRWMRELLRGFADRGGTVLLSSHLLAEVEAVADRMMIIGNGRIQAQGTRAELLADSGTIVEADDLAELDAAMHRAGLATHPADGDRRLVEAEPEVVARAAMADGVVLRRLSPAADAGLERLFFELTTSGASTPSPQTDSIRPELAGATA